MKTLRLLFLVNLLIHFSCKRPEPSKMDWWKEAKFGMFIHWGVYSVPAGIYKDKEVGGPEWIMCYEKIPVAEYKTFGGQFNPVKYNPSEWANIAKEAGMKYMVITSKHHDGFAIFDSKVTDWDVVDATPYGKDLLKPLVEACRTKGMKIGFYYSHAQDWSHPGGAASRGHWDPVQDGSMDEYLDKIAVPQVQEILSNYGKLDILWWDTPIYMNRERANKFLPVIEKYPDLITNDRLGAGFKGDIKITEQHVPVTGFPGIDWETCMTMNKSWGFATHDNNWKSSTEIIRTLIDIVSKGGNFLLNVGPTKDGLIPQPAIDRLKEVGVWMKLNGEAIYGSETSPFPYNPWGGCTRKGQKLFIHIFDWPADGKINLSLLNKVGKVYLLNEPGKRLKTKKTETGLEITLPYEQPNRHASIFVIEFSGEPVVQPLPSAGIPVIASSAVPGFGPVNLTDGNLENSWKPTVDDKERWVEIDLGEAQVISAVSVTEPWNQWDKKGQSFELQYLSDTTWRSAVEFKSNGTGHLSFVESIKASKFRLTITESNEPIINEWKLYRPY